MITRIYIPADTSACACGADETAAAVEREAGRRDIAVEIVRTGSRGAYWLEPLLEVDSPDGRIGFGGVDAEEVAELFDAGFPALNAEHVAAIGRVEDLPWLKSQTRVTFVRAGVVDPRSLEDYRRHGGFQALQRALALSGQAIVDEISASGLRGRGGAAFPAGIKWQTVLDAKAAAKYIVCNADEGDSGTFADRLLMESDPFQLIEGMLIAGLALGAGRGFIYLRSEYPRALAVLEDAISAAVSAGYLGDDVCGSGRAFQLEVRLGAGSYICGEETALLESLEGRRGVVRAKPPVPAISGLFGRPTLVHNVLSLAAVTTILSQGAAAYQALGQERSRGTLVAQLGGNIRHGGLVEVPYGLSLQDLLDTWGGGTASGLELRAVQVGGPLGAYLPAAQWQTPLDYEAFAAIGAMLGHGGIVAFDETVDMAAQARFAMEFCALESCGKCTPCRIGSVRGIEVIDRISQGQARAENVALLHDLCDTMEQASLCAMGGLTPLPVRSAIRHFPEDFGL